MSQSQSQSQRQERKRKEHDEEDYFDELEEFLGRGGNVHGDARGDVHGDDMKVFMDSISQNIPVEDDDEDDDESIDFDHDQINVAFNGNEDHVSQNMEDMKNYDEDDWKDFFQSLSDTKIDDQSETKDVVETMKRLYFTFCMGIKDDWNEIGKRFNHIYEVDNLNADGYIRQVLTNIHSHMSRKGLFDKSDVITRQLSKEFDMILVSLNAVRQCFSAKKVVGFPEDEYRLMNISFSFPLLAMGEASVDISLCKPQTKLLYFYLAKLRHLNMRIRVDNSMLYKPHLNEQGRFLYHYEQYDTVEEFCNRALYPNIFHQDWVMTTFEFPNAIHTCIQQIENRLLDQLPRLETNKDLFAFRNGLYHTGYDRFYHFPFYADPDENKYFDPTDDLTVDDLPPDENVTACSYIDEFFAWHVYREKLHNHGVYNTYRDGEVGEICDLKYIRPIAVKIFSCQNYEFDSMVFTFAMIGRLFFKADQFDSWQSIVTNYGLAGTGKSLIAQFLIYVLGIENVGILANNAQSDFGIYKLVDKRVILGLDLDDRLTIDRATFNSMVSNEPVAVNVKHKDQKVVPKWSSHIMICCNVLRANDQAGSWQRREVLIPFLQKVKDVDKDFNFLSKMKQASGLIVKVFISCYHFIRLKVGKGFVKSYRSLQLIQLENRVYEEFDPLRAFVAQKCEIFEKGRNNDSEVENKEDLSEEDILYNYSIFNNDNKESKNGIDDLRTVDNESIKEFTVAEKTLRSEYNAFVQNLPNVRRACKFSVDFVKNYGDYIQSCNRDQNPDISKYNSKYLIGIRMRDES